MNNDTTIKISEETIKEAVALAIHASLPPEKQKVIMEQLFIAILTKKDNRGFSSDKSSFMEDILREHASKWIREEVVEVIAEYKPEIHLLVKKYFGLAFKEQILKQIEDSFARAVAKELNLTITLAIDERLK